MVTSKDLNNLVWDNNESLMSATTQPLHPIAHLGYPAIWQYQYAALNSNSETFHVFQAQLFIRVQEREVGLE